MARTQLIDSLTVLASSAKTSSNNGSAIDLAGNLKGAVVLKVTAVSGTSPTLTAFIEGSHDGGTTWMDMAYSAKWNSTGDANDVAHATNSKLLVTNLTTTGTAYAVYPSLTPYIRIKWVIGGTSPSFTMSAQFIGA